MGDDTAPLCTLDDLLACLDIESGDDDHYTGPNLELPYYRIFGGQLLAQAIAIAAMSAPGKSVKSIHATFPRQGDLRKRVDYHLERVQDGRTFGTRFITGRQDAKSIFTALVSLHVHEEGLEHQPEAPAVCAPDAATPTDLSMIPWEVRIVGGVHLAAREVGPPRLEFWQRIQSLPDDRTLHQALFAHSTDLTLIGTSLRPHAGVSEADSPDRIQTAVTTHTIWFHRPVRMDEWLLIAQESPTTSGARGFGLGHAYCAGDLVASFAQESMIRPNARAAGAG